MVREWLNSDRWLGRILCRLTRGKDTRCACCGGRTWWLGVLWDQTKIVICEGCDARLGYTGEYTASLGANFSIDC